MEAVFLTKYLLEMAQCDIIGFSGTQDFHNILDLHSLSNRLKNKASKSQLLTIEAKQKKNPFLSPKSRVDTHKMGLGSAIH